MVIICNNTSDNNHNNDVDNNDDDNKNNGINSSHGDNACNHDVTQMGLAALAVKASIALSFTTIA